MATAYYRPESSKLLGGGSEIPSPDALERLLTDAQPAYPTTNGAGSERRRRTHGTRPEDASMQNARAASPSNLVDYHMAELTKYRETVHAQSEEILALRTRIRDLEANNGDLRRSLNGFNEHVRVAVETTADVEALDKRQLGIKYNTLVSRLAMQTSEVQDYRDKVLLLQKELIRKNDEARELLKKAQAATAARPAQLNFDLEDRLEERTKKVRALEDLCRNQEKIIAKMEKMLDSKSKESVEQRGSSSTGLQEENARLRKVIQDLTDSQRAADRGAGPQGAGDREDMLLQHERQERAEGRIRSLEKQLSENARRWAHERADLLLRLQEAENGLNRADPLDYRPPYRTAGYTSPGRAYSSPLPGLDDYTPRDLNGLRRPTLAAQRNQKLPNINSSY